MSACRSLRPFGVSRRRFVNGLAGISPSRCASANIVRATRVVLLGHSVASRRAVGPIDAGEQDVAGIVDDALDRVAVRALCRRRGACVVAEPDHGPVTNGPGPCGRSDAERRSALRVDGLGLACRTSRSSAACRPRSGRRP